jgi:sigma-54-specific transcriptional regulator
MVAVPHMEPAERPVGLSAKTQPGGRPVLAFDSDKHHMVGARARAFVFSDPQSRALVPLIELSAWT